MDDIITIDCLYLDEPQFAAAYLMIEGGEAAFIDNNTNHALPRLLGALGEAGLQPEQVRYLIVTHVHLDHAGATSALAEACPDATVLAHPRAVRHIVDPEKLVSSATAVYGEAEFRRLYGRIGPVPAARIREMGDGERLKFGRRELTFLHTRGHANHHFCVTDDRTNSVFTGDAFGLHYPVLQTQGPFAFPSTSPTDFDGPLARDAVQRIADLEPATVYPTHFGAVTSIEETAGQLDRHLRFAERVMHDAEVSDLPDEALYGYILPRLRDYFAGLLDGRGDLGSRRETWKLLDLDLDLNAQGLAFAANKRRRKAREARA
ncbi:MBL fold metallo-hydrolase [Lentisalinibacter sediminis]|uniref:MBL fold metallo-hydrolase n=1 Tax=Lentisalinibacter sediminis TaxID=2992237 RepID=UPI003863533A